jgi:hypothetical protein
MLKALILGLAISCLLLGIECLAVEQIKLPQGDSRIVIIPEVFGWLLIGIGSSTTLYTLINRSSSLVNSSSDVNTTTMDTDDESASHHQWDTTDYKLTEHYHDDEETDDAYEEYDAYDENDEDEDEDDDTDDEEDYFETDEEDESEPEFDLEKFNQQFDIDELLDE